jgi:hypothetical protein
MKPPRDTGIIHAYLTKYSHYFQAIFFEYSTSCAFLEGWRSLKFAAGRESCRMQGKKWNGEDARKSASPVHEE